MQNRSYCTQKVHECSRWSVIICAQVFLYDSLFKKKKELGLFPPVAACRSVCFDYIMQSGFFDSFHLTWTSESPVIFLYKSFPFKNIQLIRGKKPMSDTKIKRCTFNDKMSGQLKSPQFMADLRLCLWRRRSGQTETYLNSIYLKHPAYSFAQLCSSRMPRNASVFTSFLWILHLAKPAPRHTLWNEIRWCAWCVSLISNNMTV